MAERLFLLVVMVALMAGGVYMIIITVKKFLENNRIGVTETAYGLTRPKDRGLDELDDTIPLGYGALEWEADTAMGTVAFTHLGAYRVLKNQRGAWLMFSPDSYSEWKSVHTSKEKAKLAAEEHYLTQGLVE
jgi:hypothetical protein